MPAICPFCNLDAPRILLENAVGIAMHDGFPVSNGHTLVVPKRHVASLFDLPGEEQAALWRLVAEVRAKLLAEFRPEGFNIGVNDGQAAGQTVAHAHIHVIPRYSGDVAAARGGVRWVIPEKAGIGEAMAIPSPEDQVKFLRNVQRLLAEGLFVASYKFALLHALADLAVLKGDDTGAPLDLDTRDIAAKFVELYWQQCRPFQTGGGNAGLILQQNTGRQAAIISHITQAQQESGGSLFRLRQTAPDLWSSLVCEVDQVVRVMPLWKLQTVGDERLDFLYDNVDRGTKITLKAGVAYCLRAFYELLRDLIQGAWVRFVQKVNANNIGNVTDLGTFLFGNERTSLEAYRPILTDIQKGECLYCRKPLPRNSQVDHFVPWSRYPADLGHNFVLAHATCNHAKSDYLAAEDHLAAWSERNRLNGEELLAQLREAALPCDLSASVQVAQWAYEQTEKANGQVWLMERTLRHLSPTWRECFAA